jgi:hypothetical protein
MMTILTQTPSLILHLKKEQEIGEERRKIRINKINIEMKINLKSF